MTATSVDHAAGGDGQRFGSGGSSAPAVSTGPVHVPLGGQPARAAARPTEEIDRTAPVTFLFNGRLVSGFEGDTIASAIAASGIRTLSRSRRRHERLGLSSVDGWDAGALLQVDDEPNVPTAVRAARPGLVVRTQHVWPDLDHDLKALARRADSVLGLGVGEPASALGSRLRPLYRRLAQRLDLAGRPASEPGARAAGVTSPGGASLGRPGEPRAAAARTAGAVEHVRCDVVVIGGGPAGLAAAAAAIETGVAVCVVEAEPRLGGSARWWPGATALTADRNVGLTALVATVTEGADVRLGATVVECQPDGSVVALRDHAGLESLLVVHASFVIVATGALERRLPFEGDHLPGVLLSTGAARLANLWSVRGGARALVVADARAAERAASVAASLAAVGTEVVDIVTIGGGAGHLRALGAAELDAVVLPDGRRVEVDTLVTSFGATIDPGPLLGLGCDLALEQASGGLVVAATPASVRVLGALAGLDDLEPALAHAAEAGRAAARSVARRASHTRVGPPTPPSRIPGSAPTVRRPVRGTVDPAEDRTVDELDGFAASIAAAASLLLPVASAPASDVRTRAVLASLAASSSVTAPLAEVILTAPGPMRGPQLATLAAAGQLPLLRRSPLHDEHLAAGARLAPAAGWFEVLDYGDAAAESAAAAHAVVVRDRSSSGLFELAGPDAEVLLTRLFDVSADTLATTPPGEILRVDRLGGAGAAAPEVAGRTVELVRIGPRRWQIACDSATSDDLRYGVLAVLQIEDRSLRAHLVAVGDAWCRVGLAGPARDVAAQHLGLEAIDEASVRAGGDETTARPWRGVRRSWTIPGTDVTGWAWVRPGAGDELELHVVAGVAATLWAAALDAVARCGGRPAGLLAADGFGELLLERTTVATRRTLHPAADRVAWGTGGVRHDALQVVDLAPVGKVAVRAAPAGRFARELGVPAGAVELFDDGLLVAGVVPGEWLALVPGPAGSIVEQLERLADDPDVVVVDLTHGLGVFRIVGREVATVLARLGDAPFDERTLPDGTVRATLVAAATALVLRDDLLASSLGRTTEQPATEQPATVQPATDQPPAAEPAAGADDGGLGAGLVPSALVVCDRSVAAAVEDALQRAVRDLGGAEVSYAAYRRNHDDL